MVEREDYANAGRNFLTKAFEELAQGDTVQASEKGWGAAAQMVKAIAERRGWPHNGHAYLYQVVRRLVEETGDDELDTYFHVAGNLHSNFYENWLPPGSVESGLLSVRRLIAKLEPMLT